MAGFVWMTFGSSRAEVVREDNSDKERITLAGVGRVGAPKGAGSPGRLALALCLLQETEERRKQHCADHVQRQSL